MSRTIWIVSVLFTCSLICTAGKVDVDWISAWDYIFSCQKSNGAFGPKDQTYTDLAWTYPAVASLKILEVDLPDIDGCAKYGTNSPYTMPYWSMYQKTLLEFLLFPDKNDPFVESQNIRLSYVNPTDTNPVPFTCQDDCLSYYDISSLMYAVTCMKIQNRNIGNKGQIVKYLNESRAPDGSYNGHIVSTAHTLITLAYLDSKPASLDATLSWIKKCQKTSGGFGWHPEEKHFSNQADIWYTYEAIRALRAWNDRPQDMAGCIEWINLLQNFDGGFGDRPGWDSRLYSTYYSVHSLQMLTGDVRKAIKQKAVEKKTRSYNGMNIYQAYHYFPYADEESVRTLHSLGFNLVSIAQQRTKQDISAADSMNTFARQNGYPLEITFSSMFYQSLEFPGSARPILQLINILFPSQPQQSRLEYCRLIQKNRQDLSFRDYSLDVLDPVCQSGCLCYPKNEHGMINAYMMYGFSSDVQYGFNAFAVATSTGKDLVRLYPYRERFINKLPLMIDSETTTAIDEWKQHANTCRILYLAKSNSRDNYIEACKSGAIVCVIRNPDISKGVVFYGNPAAVNVVRQNISKWKWWSRKEVASSNPY